VIAYWQRLGRAERKRFGHQGRAGGFRPGPTQDELPARAQDKQNWLYASKDYSGQRFVDLRQITPKERRSCGPSASFRAKHRRAHSDECRCLQGVM